MRARGAGTVFKITPSGTLATVYDFCSQDSCADGKGPDAGLIQASDGNFYGTTNQGGANLVGTIFRITLAGTLTTLYSFCSQDGCTDGAYPEAELVQASDGSLYGTTYRGGNGTDSGTIFKIAVGLSGPNAVLSTSSLSFGGFPLGVESSAQSVAVTNDGTADLIFNAGAVTLSGPDAADFFITSDTCSGYTISSTAPNNTCLVSVAFMPSTTNAESAILSFADNGGNNPQAVALSGSGFSIDARFRHIIDQVNALYSQGVLNSGQDSSLVQKLLQANYGLRHTVISWNHCTIFRPYTTAMLQAFINEVTDLESSGVLTPSQAGSLDDAASNLSSAVGIIELFCATASPVTP